MWLLTWQMRWLNKSAAKINDTLQLLDIYRYRLACNLGKRMDHLKLNTIFIIRI